MSETTVSGKTRWLEQDFTFYTMIHQKHRQDTSQFLTVYRFLQVVMTLKQTPSFPSTFDGKHEHFITFDMKTHFGHETRCPYIQHIVNGSNMVLTVLTHFKTFNEA